MYVERLTVGGFKIVAEVRVYTVIWLHVVLAVRMSFERTRPGVCLVSNISPVNDQTDNLAGEFKIP